MKFAMKILAPAGAALALLMSTQTLAADWCNLSGDWVAGAHALVFTPVTCEYDYASVSTTEGDQPVSTVKCELDWGFRVFGQYLSRCSFTGISYQWYESKASDSTTAELLVNRHAFVGRQAIANLSLRYQNVDVRMGKFLHRTCGHAFYLFGNARWVDLQDKRLLRTIGLESDVVDVTQTAKLQGGALGVGAGAECNLWCDLGLFGEANILGVIADRSTSASLVTTTSAGQATVIDFQFGSDTCVNPEVNFRLGLDYSYTCGCWTFVGELGYELDYFWNAVSISQGDVTVGTPSLFRGCENVGFSGLFFGGRVLF
jgi:Legionella pneumophila major outer membrane protein precursor